ncbi:hypothetical protein JCM21900_000193 [Sporobolomyces salmonicolor]
MSTRPPLPFGLGRDPACAPDRCNSPGTPLPAPGTPLHDQVASSLSQLFQTFFTTSLRYLGTSEILDWLELNGTVDAWILTGLEQGRLPEEVGNKKNLEFGREAIKSVIKSALEAEDEAWATSLRETGFSSALSMAYEGIVAQLKPSKSAPLPCLHTLLTPTGLSMLKSAPLKSAFPICPPRSAPSPSPLLASIRSLIQRGALVGPSWKTPTTWRAHIRKSFAAYHSMLREIAEELVSDPDFSKEFRIFLENISQPIQLLQLISEDFESELGRDAQRGLLCVGDVGGDNLLSIMDFCAAKKPSELLARVKQRVAEKHEREKRSKEIQQLRAQIKELDTQIRELLLDYRSGEIGPERTHQLQRELEETLDRRDAVKKEVEDLQAREDHETRERKREKSEREQALARVGITVDPASPISQLAKSAMRAAATTDSPAQDEKEMEKLGFKLGSSKDLLLPEPPKDPFAATAPRAVSPLPGSKKGKAKALVQPGKPRGTPRYAPPPPAHRYDTARPPRSFSPASSLPVSRSVTPSSSRAPSPAPVSSRKRAPAPSSDASSPSRRAASRLPTSRLSRTPTASTEEDEDDYCEECCPACAAEHQRDAGSGGGEMQVEQGAVPLSEATNTGLTAAPLNTKKKKKKKKTAGRTTTDAAPSSVSASVPPPAPARFCVPPIAPASSPSPTSGVTLPPPLRQGFSPLSRYPPPKCCPPDRCTGVTPDYGAWAELDGLLYQTCLAGFKYELIGALPAPLFHLREKLARNYLLSGGKMCNEAGEPKSMDDFLQRAEARGMWSTGNHPEVAAWSQRVFAISLQKLAEVLRATLGEICICKLSNHLDILREARHRLEQCEALDRTIPIDLAEMSHQEFMKWAHVQLRGHRLSGPEWEGLDRQYKLANFLLSFSDAFDAAMDRLVLRDAFVLADDFFTLLEWQGGIRTFDTALRFGKAPIAHEWGTGLELLEGKEEGREERRPLQSWGRLLELSKEARARGTPFSRDLAEQEKQKGNEHFAAGEYEKAIVSFSTANIIVPTEPTFPSNAAAARMKLGTLPQYAEAISDCTIALFYDPQCIKALYRRGTALAMLGHWKAAFADLKHLERIAPDNQPAKDALAWATERYQALSQGSKGAVLTGK